MTSVADNLDFADDGVDPIAEGPAAAQTIEQHRAAAVALLRRLVDDPKAKAQDRRAAASDLLKELESRGDDPVSERRAMQLTDEQLLLVIEDARQARAQNTGGTPRNLVLEAVADFPKPGPGAAITDIDWSTNEPPAPVGMGDFEAMLSDIPDMPEANPWD